MKLKQLFFSTFFSIVLFASCSKKKDEVTHPAVSIEGEWVGKSSALSEPYSNHFSFSIKAGGILDCLDANGVKIGEGTWAFNSNKETITATCTITGGETFSIIANFDKYNEELAGTWRAGTDQIRGGYWYWKKVRR